MMEELLAAESGSDDTTVVGVGVGVGVEMASADSLGVDMSTQRTAATAACVGPKAMETSGAWRASTEDG